MSWTWKCGCDRPMGRARKSMTESRNTFEGGVFSPQLETGRASAMIRIDGGVVAETRDGQEFRIRYDELRFEVGDQSPPMVFCLPQGNEPTIFCDDPAFPRALLLEMPEASRLQWEDALSQGTKRRWKYRGWLASVVGTVVALALLFYLSYGMMIDTLVPMLPWVVDQEIGEFTSEVMNLEERAIDAPKVRENLDRIMERIHVDDIPVKISYWVVDDPTANAFALPGGYMALHSGLIETTESPEELAGVIAHEYAHISERHGLKGVAHALGLAILIQLIVGDAGGLISLQGEIIEELTGNAYSRQHEAESDRLAVERLQRSQIDPTAFSAFFSRPREGGSLPGQSWWSTHPSNEDRQEQIEEMSKEAPPTAYRPIEVDWKELQRAIRAASKHPKNTKTPAAENPSPEEPSPEEPSPEEPSHED